MTQRNKGRWLSGLKTRSRSTCLRSGQSLTEFIMIVVLVGFVVIGVMTRYDSSQWWRILLDHFYQDSLMMPVEMIRFDDIEEPKPPTKFEETVTRYHLSVSADPPIGGSATGTGFYSQGTRPASVIGQSPSSGYHFVKWEGDIHAPLKDNVSITAKYVKKSGGGGGSDKEPSPSNKQSDTKVHYHFGTINGNIEVRGYVSIPKHGENKRVTYVYGKRFNLKQTIKYDWNYPGTKPPIPPAPDLKYSNTSKGQKYKRQVMVKVKGEGWSKLGTVHLMNSGDLYSIRITNTNRRKYKRIGSP